MGIEIRLTREGNILNSYLHSELRNQLEKFIIGKVNSEYSKEIEIIQDDWSDIMNDKLGFNIENSYTFYYNSIVTNPGEMIKIIREKFGIEKFENSEKEIEDYDSALYIENKIIIDTDDLFIFRIYENYEHYDSNSSNYTEIKYITIKKFRNKIGVVILELTPFSHKIEIFELASLEREVNWKFNEIKKLDLGI